MSSKRTPPPEGYRWISDSELEPIAYNECKDRILNKYAEMKQQSYADVYPKGYVQMKEALGEFKKYDQSKPTFNILCDLLDQLGRVDSVMQYGAAKYGRDNWKKATSAEDIRRYKNAAIRHLMLSLTDEERDPESNKGHIDHAATNCLFIMYLEDYARRQNTCATSPGPASGMAKAIQAPGHVGDYHFTPETGGRIT